MCRQRKPCPPSSDCVFLSVCLFSWFTCTPMNCSSPKPMPILTIISLIPNVPGLTCFSKSLLWGVETEVQRKLRTLTLTETWGSECPRSEERPSSSSWQIDSVLTLGWELLAHGHVPALKYARFPVKCAPSPDFFLHNEPVLTHIFHVMLHTSISCMSFFPPPYYTAAFLWTQATLSLLLPQRNHKAGQDFENVTRLR